MYLYEDEGSCRLPQALCLHYAPSTLLLQVRWFEVHAGACHTPGHEAGRRHRPANRTPLCAPGISPRMFVLHSATTRSLSPVLDPELLVECCTANFPSHWPDIPVYLYLREMTRAPSKISKAKMATTPIMSVQLVDRGSAAVAIVKLALCPPISTA